MGKTSSNTLGAYVYVGKERWLNEKSLVSKSKIKALKERNDDR